MKERVIELTKSGTKVSKSHGLIHFKLDDNTIKVPVDDFGSVLILGPDISITTGAITALLERNVPIVFSDDKYLPLATLVSDRGHHQLQLRRKLQSEISELQVKRFWQKIVQKKIRLQADLIQSISKDDSMLRKFIEEVQSGDVGNHEAQAARLYWKILFGSNFVRDRQGGGFNQFLNYGYAILRNSVARAVSASGLNPNVGLFHSNMSNAFCLVDDLMEPFRPLVDAIVKENETNWEELGPKEKAALVQVLQAEVVYKGQKKSLQSMMHDFVFNYVEALSEGDYRQFDLDFAVEF